MTWLHIAEQLRQQHEAKEYIDRKHEHKIRQMFPNRRSALLYPVAQDVFDRLFQAHPSGSGTVQVNWRLLTGQDASGGFTYKPVSARCNVGTFAAIEPSG